MNIVLIYLKSIYKYTNNLTLDALISKVMSGYIIMFDVFFFQFKFIVSNVNILVCEGKFG